MSGKEENMGPAGGVDRHMWLTVSGSLLPRRLQESAIRRRDKHLHPPVANPTSTLPDRGASDGD